MNAPIEIANLPGDFVHTTLDKLYKLDGVLTEDTTGTIFGTKTKIRTQTAALNVLAPNCTVISRKLIRIDHPNICKAHKVLTLKDGSIVIVIDKPEGKPILEFMKEDASYLGFNAGRAISAVMQLLSALHAVHQASKTARNLSVNNIFVHRDKNGNLRLKLVSLGIGGTGVNLKSPHYFSPERIMNIDRGDPRADIWAAGAVFYHLCFGRPPFGDNAETAQKNMLETPDFDPGDRNIPNALVDIIKRAIERDENRRYQTVSEMIGDLLPLREIHTEPMSDDVSVALKKSYPPPPPLSPGKLTPKKPIQPSVTALHPCVSLPVKLDKSETTAEYGKDGKPSARKTAAWGRFLGVDFSPHQKETAGKKTTARTRQAEVSKTIMGIPAIQVEEEMPASVAKPPLKKSPARKGDESGSLLSARSILGSDEDIQTLEKELSFLEDRKDEDVPTLVLGERNFAALTDTLESEKIPSRRQTANEPCDDSLNVAETASAPPPYLTSSSAPPTANLLPRQSSLKKLLSTASIQRLKNYKFYVAGLGIALALAFFLTLVLSPTEKNAPDPVMTVTALPPSPAMAKQPPPSVTEVVVQPAEISGLPTAATAKQEEAPAAASFVTVAFPNVPPNSEITVNGRPTPQPVQMPKSKNIVAIAITAEGYAPFKVRIVPDRDRELPVRLTPKRSSAPNGKNAETPKKNGKPKSKKSTGNLVSNPFKK